MQRRDSEQSNSAGGQVEHGGKAERALIGRATDAASLDMGSKQFKRPLAWGTYPLYVVPKISQPRVKTQPL